jgi:hypothetical protein
MLAEAYVNYLCGAIVDGTGFVGTEAWQSRRVTITWSTGFSGVSLHLQADGDRLRGHAKVFDDVIELIPAARARAVAVRTACRD